MSNLSSVLRGRLLGVAFLVLATLPVASEARATEPSGTYLVGASVVDVTPPWFKAKDDAVAFPACPTAVFAGARRFGLQEPYRDLNGNGRFDPAEPFCDANANTRYDGLYLSSGTDNLALTVHDRIDARGLAISDGHNTAVLVSVTSQGLFETYTHRIRDEARRLRPGITDVIVSSNHNESSPDPIGIYGAPDLGGNAPVGLRSSVDDYYMAFLVDRVAHAAVQAYDARKPASLKATTFSLPPEVSVQLSHNFPTTDDDREPAAIDPKVRVLQALDASGQPIATVMNLAAHNQEIGHSRAHGREISADWPGSFHRRLESLVGGSAMFLVGANGSEEDPETVPSLDCDSGCYRQAEATGNALAEIVAARLPDLEPVAFGPVRIERDEFFVPLENNLFTAAAAGGLFAQRVGYVAGVPVGPGLGQDFLTEVSLIDVGPDVQLLGNPAESFPALIFGSPWGIEDAPCPERPNPSVPAWAATARFRFEVGLADDLIGYLMPAWAFATTPGIYTTTCTTDPDTDRDSKGHQHKLETESVGPTAGNLVAEHLTALVQRDHASAAQVVRGRFVLADGTTTRRPRGAVAAVLLEDGTRITVRNPVDYDGQAQPEADVTTRGVLTEDGRTLFLDVYPAIAAAP